MRLTPEERTRRILRSTWQGALGGELRSAQPDFGSEASVTVDSLDSSGDSSSEDLWVLDRKVLTLSGAQTWQLTYVPIEEAVNLRLNGLSLAEGSEYTVNWVTGLVTITTPDLTVADVLTARYQAKGDSTGAVQDTLGALAPTGWIAPSYVVVIGGKASSNNLSVGATGTIDTGAAGAQAISVDFTVGSDPTHGAVIRLRARVDAAVANFYEFFYDAHGFCELRRIGGAGTVIYSSGSPVAAGSGVTRHLTLSIDSSGNLTASDGNITLTGTDNALTGTRIQFVANGIGVGSVPNTVDNFVGGGHTDDFDRFPDNTPLDGQGTLT